MFNEILIKSVKVLYKNDFDKSDFEEKYGNDNFN